MVGGAASSLVSRLSSLVSRLSSLVSRLSSLVSGWERMAVFDGHEATETRSGQPIAVASNGGRSCVRPGVEGAGWPGGTLGCTYYSGVLHRVKHEMQKKQKKQKRAVAEPEPEPEQPAVKTWTHSTAGWPCRRRAGTWSARGRPGGAQRTPASPIVCSNRPCFRSRPHSVGPPGGQPWRETL